MVSLARTSLLSASKRNTSFPTPDSRLFGGVRWQAEKIETVETGSRSHGRKPLRQRALHRVLSWASEFLAVASLS